MEYRILPHGGEKISVIGLGTGSVTGTEEQMVEILHTAIDHGVNFFDLASIDREPGRGHHRDEAFRWWASAGRQDL